jgi:signal transduction histidine kinase
MVVESEDILIAIVISYVIIIALVFTFLIYFNRSRNQRIWRPFFENLDRMKNFSLNSRSPISLVDSDIMEFSELNREISTLTDKVRFDYENLKQFTEDVSHEVQTPLAIIQAKIENIINTNTINDEQYEQLTSIQKDIKRLTQLNKRLTLITKIDNNQFVNLEWVVLTDLVRDIIQNFRELTTATITFNPEEEIRLKMDPYLAEILCSNLISNAIRYGDTEGGVQITSGTGFLAVANKGKEAIRRPQLLFNRFYKESVEHKSTGLGLAIAKRICDLYGFRISYVFREGYHLFRVEF